MTEVPGRGSLPGVVPGRLHVPVVAAPPEPVSNNESSAASEALALLRARVEGLKLPMETPGAASMRHERDRMLRLLDDFLGRHVARRDAPFLVVIGGPTGAGKSTLLNSLIDAKVSKSGVLRPTTADPVLVYNPEDGPAFFRHRLLPDLIPATAGGSDLTASDAADDAPRLRLVPSEDIAPGLAVIDSPDFDSYRVAHHDLAANLLDIADLWLYVTTGTDYARAVPWDFLRAAASRRLGLATVLNRMRQHEVGEVPDDLVRLMKKNELGVTSLFVIPEVQLYEERIPHSIVLPLWQWLQEQAGDPEARRRNVEKAVEGTIDEILVVVERLAVAGADQVVADRRLRVDLRASFRRAREDAREAVDGGTIELGDTTTSLAEPARARSGGRFRRLLGGAGEADSQRAATEAFVAAVGAFVRRVNIEAVTRVAQRWALHPAASGIALDSMLEMVPDFDDRVAAFAREWLAEIAAATSLPSAQSQHLWPPSAALQVAVLALSGPAGNEAGVAGLDALREKFLQRIDAVLDDQEAQIATLLDQVSGSSVTELREAGTAFRAAWRDVANS